MAEKTLEELQAELAALTKENKALAQDKEHAEAEAKRLAEQNGKLAAVVDAAKEEKAKTAPVSFTVKEGKHKGKYQFTCPTFTWDDGSVINVRQLAGDAKKDEASARKYQDICAHLVARESGIVRKED